MENDYFSWGEVRENYKRIVGHSSRRPGLGLSRCLGCAGTTVELQGLLQMKVRSDVLVIFTIGAAMVRGKP
jgi:hypothetical protein